MQNQECGTGYSPSGHCGAAFYCEEPYHCCAACRQNCNMRCGWLPERGVELNVHHGTDGDADHQL